jgi:predicted transcriptional regulator
MEVTQRAQAEAKKMRATVLRHKRNTGETQDAMARRCGVNVLLINRICNGHCQRHNAATVAAIMRGIGDGDAI